MKDYATVDLVNFVWKILGVGCLFLESIETFLLICHFSLSNTKAIYTTFILYGIVQILQR